MAVLRNAASNSALYLARELNLDQRNADTIRYGIEIILGTIIQGITIISISYLLEMMPYVLVALATLSTLRLLSGGAHFSTFGRCTALSTSMAVSIGYLVIMIAPYMNKKAMLLLAILIALLGLYSIKRWAPVDSFSKPITRKDKREKYKKLSLLYVIFWAAAVTLVVLIRGEAPSTPSLVLASTGGFIVQIFSLCPSGRRLVDTIDYILDRLTIRR